MCIKKIALCFILFVLMTFVAVNTADAEEKVNHADIEQSISEQNIPVQINFVGEVSTAQSVGKLTDAAASEEAPQTVDATDDTNNKEEKADEAASDSTDGDKNAKKSSDKDSKKSKKSSKKSSKKNYTKKELRLMATIIYCESGNQSYAGKLAVGVVVMNRVRSKSFANSVKSVIYQRGQFSPTWNGTLKRALARYDAGKFNSKAEKECVKAAKAALNGETTIKVNGKKRDCSDIHFFSARVSGAKFRIGCHQFK